MYLNLRKYIYFNTNNTWEPLILECLLFFSCNNIDSGRLKNRFSVLFMFCIKQILRNYIENYIEVNIEAELSKVNGV